jgi:hypothetical protein
MTMRRVAIALAGALGASLASAQPGPVPPAPATSGLYLVEFRTGPGWRPDRPPQDQAGFAGHSANLARLRAAGILLFGARYGDTGVVLLRVADEAAARLELEPDPSLPAGVFVAQVHEFRPFYPGEVPASGAPAPASAAPAD